MGTLLGERGVGFGHPYARANLSHPEMVAGIHEEYLRTGASVIETNTFSANRYKLEIHDLEDSVRQVNVERGAIRKADDEADLIPLVPLAKIHPARQIDDPRHGISQAREPRQHRLPLLRRRLRLQLE